MGFSGVDMIILVIVLASALMALLRGLTREVLTIIAWVIAAVGAIMAFPVSRGIFREFLKPELLGDAVGFIVVFFIVLIPALMLASHVIRRFGLADPGVLDRTGGFLFGVARGLFIVGLAYWGNEKILEPGSVPGWIENSRLRPIVVAVADLFPEDIGSLSNSTGTTPPPEGTSSEKKDDEEDDTGYAQRDRRNLDQLITTTSED